MKRTLVVTTLAALMIVMTAAMAMAQPAVAPPAAPATLWSFMGIPQGMNKVHGALFNRRGGHPFLEKKPPLKSIADPANLAAENPAIKRAAQVKQEEDLKPQKIKAIKYLAKVGCGCYDKDGSISKAMVAAMDDCTEDVRLAAVEAINTAGRGEQCENCKQKSCCNEEVVKKLAEIVYERDEHGCYKEPSERVRKAAEEAMAACCTGRGPLVIENATPEPEQGEPRPDVPADVPPPPAQAGQSELRDARFVSSRRTAHLHAAAGDRAAALGDSSRDLPNVPRPTSGGLTILVDVANQQARVVLPGSETLPVGTRLAVYDATDGQRLLGELEVQGLQQGSLVVRPAKGLDLASIGPGTIVRRAQQD